jgi:hypothetical protein
VIGPGPRSDRVARIHVACVIGPDESPLLPRFLEHYRARGVESFYLVRHAESAAAPGYRRIAEHAAAAGIPLFHSQVGPWSLELQQRLFRYVMDEHPDDWFVIADSDEFHVYDRPLRAIVEVCEARGFDIVTGCFLDRIAANGGFPPVGAGSLWSQFPLAGSISATLLCALPLKAALARGYVELLTGQHGAPLAVPLPSKECFVQVNHFKWTAGIVERMRRRVARYDAGELADMHPSMIRESRRFLSHVARHQGRINVDDPRLRLHPCGDGHGEHPEWDAIRFEAQGWQWTLR